MNITAEPMRNHLYFGYVVSRYPAVCTSVFRVSVMFAAAILSLAPKALQSLQDDVSSMTSSTASIMAVNSICSIRSLFASYLSQNTPNSTHATAHAQEPAALHIG